MDFSGPPQQSSFNGAPDNLMFSSVIPVWPPAQPWLQLSAKTRDLLPLSGGGGCKGKGKKNLNTTPEASLEFEVIFSSSGLSALVLYWPTELLVAAVCLIWWSCSCSYWFQSLLCLKLGWLKALCSPSITSIDRCPHLPHVVLAARPLFKIELLLHAFCNAVVLLTLWIKSFKCWMHLRQLMQAPRDCHVSVIYSHLKWIKSNQAS